MDNLLERIMVRVKFTETCWLWTGAHHPKQGHPQIRFDYKLLWVHREMFRLAYGIDPGELNVCHHCDTPPCVRPSHLFLGDQKDNMADAARKGRTCRKLSHADVTEIKKLLREGVKVSSLARHYGVAYNAIWSIKKGKNYNYIP